MLYESTLIAQEEDEGITFEERLLQQKKQRQNQRKRQRQRMKKNAIFSEGRAFSPRLQRQRQ